MTNYCIRIAGVDESYMARGNATVLQALAPAHHRLIASGCHGGGCGVCRIRIVAGDYRSGTMSRAHVPVDDQAQNIALACRIWPLGDMIVEPLGKRIATARPVNFMEKH